MKRTIYLLTLFFTLLTAQSLQAQLVWPGDINLDGRVSTLDVLYWGLANGATGADRPAAKSDWLGQPRGELWSGVFPDGINYLYADCNGDGVVNDEDLDEALLNNYGLNLQSTTVNPIASGEIGSDPQLILTADTDSITGGETVNISLSLGTADMPVDNFYGIAFQLTYNHELVKGGASISALEDSWIQAGQDEGIRAVSITPDDNAGRTHVALVRKDQQPVSGQGPIANGSIIIEDIIFGLQRDTLNLGVDSIQLISPELENQRVARSAFKIPVGKITTHTHKPVVSDNPMLLFPNPVQSELYIQAPDLKGELQQLHIFSALGQKLKSYTLSAQKSIYLLTVSDLPKGFYLLVAETDQVLYSSRFIKN